VNPASLAAKRWQQWLEQKHVSRVQTLSSHQFPLSHGGACRVASCNFVTGCLTENVTGGQPEGWSNIWRWAADLTNQALRGLSELRPYSLLQRVNLSQAVLSRVAF
jgi:hypothetical protein